MGYVGRLGRHSWTPLGCLSRSAACAPSASIRKFCGGAAHLGRSAGMHFGARGAWPSLLLGRRFAPSACFRRSLLSTSNALSSLRVSRPRLQSSAQGFISNRIWISLRSGTSGLHGISTLFHPCSCPLMEAVNKLGVHRAPLLQSVQAIDRRLNNSGRTTLRVLPIGGTTEFRRRNPGHQTLNIR